MKQSEKVLALCCVALKHMLVLRSRYGHEDDVTLTRTMFERYTLAIESLALRSVTAVAFYALYLE